MSLATQHVIVILAYCLVLGWRLRRFGTRWRLPLSHGPEYFMGLRVPLGFMESTGFRLMGVYRRWLVMPLVVEAISAGTLVWTGHFYAWMAVQVSVNTALDLVTRLLLLKHLRTATKPFAIEEPATPIALPLQTRTLGAYTKVWLEVLIGLTLAVCFTLIIWHGEDNRFRIVLIASYVQLGFLLIKRSLVDFRMRVPVENAEGYYQLQEQRRHIFIGQIDWLRGFTALFVVILTVETFLGADAGRWMTVVWLALALVMMTMTSRERSRLTKLSLALKPLKPKRVPAEDVKGAFLYQPDHPAMFVRRVHGYALNFGNPRTMICAAYVLGGLILGAASLRP